MRTTIACVALVALLATACGGGGGGPGANPFGRDATATPTLPASGPGTTPSPAGQETPTPTAEQPTPTANPETYTVQEGDTLSAIAEQFGLTIADLVAANDLADPDLIFPGQVLRIPAATATPTPTPSPAANPGS
jgi:LysM repeat protein